MTDIQQIPLLNLRERREQLKLTQQQVADRCYVDRSYYTNIEKGRKVPLVPVVKRIAEVLEFDWPLFFEYIECEGESLMYLDNYQRTIVYLCRNVERFRKLPKSVLTITSDTMDFNPTKLQTVSREWSSSERFFANLAIHLWTGEGNIDMNALDNLDSRSRRIALNALSMRFGLKTVGE